MIVLVIDIELHNSVIGSYRKSSVWRRTRQCQQWRGANCTYRYFASLFYLDGAADLKI